MTTWSKHEPTVAAPQRTRVPAQTHVRPPLTGMIDVTFQLLLFFLLSMTFASEEGVLPGSLPYCVPGRAPLPLRVRVWPAGTAQTGVVYEVAGCPAMIRTPRELGRVLRERADIDPGRQVIIECRRDVRWRWAIEAFNQSVRARFRHVRLTGQM